MSPEDPRPGSEPAPTAEPAAATSRRSVLGGGVAAAATALFGFQRAALAQGDPAARIVQTASFKLNPEKADEGVAALRTLTEAVEANEPGVLAYLAHRSQQDPSQIFFYEVYADQATLAAHGQTAHIGVLRELFAGGVLQPPVDIVRMDPIGGFHR